MVPALGVVGGTPGWAVRGIISIYFRAHVACENRPDWNVRTHFFIFYCLKGMIGTPMRFEEKNYV